MFISFPPLRVALWGLVASSAVAALAAVGSGDSAAGPLETLAPEPGTLTTPPSAPASPILLPYSGAADPLTGLGAVELWFRTDSQPWTYSGLFLTGGGGQFAFTPPGSEPANHGMYYFELVAVDLLGNRSAEPSGMAGTGDGAVSFAAGASVEDWSVLE